MHCEPLKDSWRCAAAHDRRMPPQLLAHGPCLLLTEASMALRRMVSPAAICSHRGRSLMSTRCAVAGCGKGGAAWVGGLLCSLVLQAEASPVSGWQSCSIVHAMPCHASEASASMRDAMRTMAVTAWQVCMCCPCRASAVQ